MNIFNTVSVHMFFFCSQNHEFSEAVLRFFLPDLRISQPICIFRQFRQRIQILHDI